MGIFSLFGKKENRQEKSAGKDSSRAKRPATTRIDTGKSGSSSRAPTVKRDAQTALATAQKIDAIESEMSSEFVNTPSIRPSGVATAPRTQQQASSAPKAPAATPDRSRSTKNTSNPAPRREAAPETLAPDLGNTTDFLLGGQSAVVDMAKPSSEAAAVIEEAAIMFANGQNEVVEQMLRDAIDEDMLGIVTSSAWQMLFDFYRIAGNQQAFDQLANNYLAKFETSPPAWTDDARPQAAPAPASGTTPMVPFSGRLDANCTRQIERIRKLAETYRSLRLEFVRVSEVDPGGCGLLLCVLKQLQKSDHELILVGAPELAEKIRAVVRVGHKGDTEDAWLLLLELMRLLNREKDFEEISIDYCVTFEVSPPAFVAPQTKITTAADEPAAHGEEVEGFRLPEVIEGRIDDLIVAIAAYSDDHDPAVIDCSQLVRIDFNAAGRLLTGLAPFCSVGKTIEFHHVNHLVAELLNVIGLKDIVRIFPRKN